MLVGRRAEQAALRALVDGAVRGRGGVLLVTGEPGMGKTVLLDDLAADRTDVTTLRASGRESDADLPFSTLAELLRSAEHVIDSLPGPQARALRGALGLETAVKTVDGLAVGVATLGVLATLALRRPVVVVIDDLQWVDEPSQASLAFVARHLSRLHVALVCAVREGEIPEHASDLPELALPRLRARDAGELLRVSARVPLDRAVRRKLLELSEGNPLALVELPTALSDAQLQGIYELGEPIPVYGGI
jgi:predicted ATPase